MSKLHQLGLHTAPLTAVKVAKCTRNVRCPATKKCYQWVK